MKKLLVACEESQRVCIEFRKKGWEAYSCDIVSNGGGHPEWHIKQDVIPLLNGNCEFITEDGIKHEIKGKWDMIIAHPPCTYLTNTGNRHFNVEKYGDKARQRLKDREKAFKFFMKFVNADCEKIIIENPIGYCSTHYKKPTQIIQPWWFGQHYTKATCLWIKGVQPLIQSIKDKPNDCKSYAWETMYDENGKTISWGSDESKRLRSKTFHGVAKAMAEQWG